MAPKSSAKMPKPEVIDPERESLQAPVDPAVRCAESEQQARWQARTRAEMLERHALVFSSHSWFFLHLLQPTFRLRYVQVAGPRSDFPVPELQY